MPKTRPEIPKQEKVDQILALAQQRLRDGGYEALAVAAIARELGLAQNAIYWYFPSKDHLFVAALEGMLQDIAARKPSRSKSTITRILWFADEFAALSGLRAAMTERSRTSPVVADFVAKLDETLARMLSNAFRGHVPNDQLPLAVETFRATVEGTFVKGLQPEERHRILTFTLERLIGSRETG